MDVTGAPITSDPAQYFSNLNDKGTHNIIIGDQLFSVQVYQSDTNGSLSVNWTSDSGTPNMHQLNYSNGDIYGIYNVSSNNYKIVKLYYKLLTYKHKDDMNTTNDSPINSMDNLANLNSKNYHYVSFRYWNGEYYMSKVM